ncbi:MAG: metal ABC transporter ATP-binding protein [Candidatus Nanopelagicales bacterium]|nr:metal ABC transporter ATP-binding protein [Candidatus Nanopelagicales bacterium]
MNATGSTVPPSPGTGDPTAAPLVEAEGLVLAYGSYVALAASTFRIPSVGVVAVIGPNGSGKSTVLMALAGLVPVAGGSLRVLGADPREARERISFVMQSTPVPPITPITVREVVGLGRFARRGMFGRMRDEDHRAVADALARMGITHLSGRHMRELSGGQRQRVLIAQGMVQQHDLLLLDEPLTGLDITSAATIDELIHEQRTDGCSVIMTTHDLDEARAADWVILVSGRVVAAGPPEQVCRREHLEVAYGLGSTHEWEGFLDDPAHDTHRH